MFQFTHVDINFHVDTEYEPVKSVIKTARLNYKLTVIEGWIINEFNFTNVFNGRRINFVNKPLFEVNSLPLKFEFKNINSIKLTNYTLNQINSINYLNILISFQCLLQSCQFF